MFFIMGLCMAMVQGGYVRRIPHGKEMIAAMSVSVRTKTTRLINRSVFFSVVVIVIELIKHTFERFLHLIR